VTDIDAVSRIRYAGGVNPIDHAVQLIAFDLEARDEAHACRLHPEIPLMQLDQSDAAYARRIVGKLLDAGWAPPQVDRTREAS
jgi:hypothetical protein